VIIINADDLGRSQPETDAILACFERQRISSTTAMMFMRDSERAARLAIERGIDVGLHLNLSQEFTALAVPDDLRNAQRRVVAFLTASKYAQLLYNPFLRRQFREVVEAQIAEFHRLYGRPPSHVDGHQHQHLCLNVLLDGLIPANHKVRRSFSFWRGEKGALNRGYRALVDRSLARRFVLADFFFSLEQCLKTGRTTRVFSLARTATVELMTHPINTTEFGYLMSDDCANAVRDVTLGSYAAAPR
jgi:predicted glycoside hydrolase/deacetylase ChbG (UPF0249 family)